MSVSANGNNLYDAVRMGAGSSIIENLQSQLKLREGEITHLQVLEKLNVLVKSVKFWGPINSTFRFHLKSKQIEK